jgi:hypothetical protein
MFCTHVHHDINGMVPYFHSDHRLLEAQKNGAWSVLFLLVAFHAQQPDNVFFPGTGSPAGGMIFSLDNLSLASDLGGLLVVPGPSGTFILPVSFLMTVGTLILP